MSYVKIWIHAVWSTKNRLPCLEGGKLQTMCEHIVVNAAAKNIFIDTINGYYDHIHVLILLNPIFSIAKQMQLIKGESSIWANEAKLFDHHFAWSAKYFAASVSGRKVPAVRNYIKNQQVHHAQTTFSQEFDHFLKSAGYSDPSISSQG